MTNSECHPLLNDPSVRCSPRVLRTACGGILCVIWAMAGCDHAPAPVVTESPTVAERDDELHLDPSYENTAPSSVVVETKAAVADSATSLAASERNEGAPSATPGETIADALRKTGAMVITDPASGQVRTVNAGPPDAYPPPLLSHDEVDLIGQCRELMFLKVNRTGMTDSHMEKLDLLKNLRHLDISNTIVTDHGFAVAKNFTALDIVNVSDTNVSDESICLLARKAPVRALYANNVVITDRGAECISRLTGLLYLRLSGTGLTNAGLEKLTTLRSLGELLIASTEIDDDGLKHLTHLSRLHTLDLSDCRITGPGLNNLAGMSIGWLKLNNTPIGDDAVDALSKLKGILVIEIRGTNMTALGIERLKKLLPNSGVRHSGTASGGHDFLDWNARR